MSLISGLFVNAQNEIGNPYIKNFNAKKYKFSETVWDITQDKKGLMYFGTASGIRRYDGTNWLMLSVDNASTVRAFDIDSNGTIYVGAKGEFGYLSEDSLGYPIYKSLSKDLEEKYKDFSDVWNIYVTKQGVFFYSFARIFKWHNNQFTIYEYNDITAHLGFHVNDNIYLVRLKTGLHYYKNNDFVLVPGGEYFIGKTMFSILPYRDNEVIVATRNEGLEILNIKTGEIKPFVNAANENLKTDRIYHGAISESGEYIIGTLNNGIYVIDRKGELLNHISQKNGLQSNNIKYIFKDKDGGIWLGNSMGVSYVELNLPLTFFNTDNNIKGDINAVIRFKDELYIATENSIYYLDTLETDLKNKFKPIENADNQFWRFLKVDDRLLVGSDGLFEIKNKKLYKLGYLKGDALFSMIRSEKYPHLIYLATKGGLVIAEILPNGEIKIAHRFKDIDIECKFLAEDAQGNLWVNTAFDYLIKIESSSFNKDAGFPLSYKQFNYDEKLAHEQLIKLKNKVLFTSSKGLLQNKGETFEAINIIKIDDKPDAFKIRELIETKKGDLWIHYHGDNDESGVFLALKKDDGTYLFQENPFTRINEKINHTKVPYIDDNSIAWFFGGEEIVRYDASKDKKQQGVYYTNISRVSFKSDSVISYKALDTPPQLIFKNNAITFTFSAATYGNEDGVYYQYLLEGQDEQWSDWTTLNSKEYNFLHEGKYTFKVRAKNVYQQISKEDKYTFIILPPWYRETWAYIVYFLGFMALILLIIKIATYRLNESKKKLESLVKARTKDILIEKEKVEQQKLQLENIHIELSERNKDVMDSIKYAQRIQSSILPSIEKLTSEFNNSFVLYQPRDIVSGDFYWYEKVGDFFVMACADCTGHGVPGAFMSMIGTTLLNKIVEQDNVLRCEDALTELDIELQKTLQQKKGQLEGDIVMDGMDISLIAINLKTKECHYSGAYRPLYLLRNKEITIFDSNRMSIGGGFIKNKKFKGESIKIVSGDQLYMFTDGIVDQFGGIKNKKFKRERLKKLLVKICDLKMNEQSKELHTTFMEWKGENEQIDDVLIMGVKIP
jgi:serine phosphatase RsbU (regulator of sigma subunit)/ligand-binding sensor domain-containing protein